MFDNQTNHHNSPIGSVIISGASSGIGEASAIHLDKLGYQVFAGVRKEADGQRLVSNSSGRIIPILLDVTDESSIVAAINQVQTVLGGRGLTALINNAGIVIPGPLEFIPISDFRKQLDVNLIGLLALTQACLPLLRKGRGRIINMSSPSGKVSLPMLGTYSASKFALEGMSNALRIELQPWAINVCLIEPAAIKTSVWEKLTSDGSQIWNSFPEQVKQLYASGFEVMYKIAVKSAKQGLPSEIVAKTVEQAITTKKPKTRYTVGFDAKIATFFARIMPDRLLDQIITLFVVPGYPTKAETKITYEQQTTNNKQQKLSTTT